MMVRTVNGVKMCGTQLWLVVVMVQVLFLTGSCSNHQRHSIPTQATLPITKGGWRPVVGQGGLLYGPFGTAPLHAPAFKIPVPVLDTYQSSARPLVARDANKLTSIAQSYRPTTHHTLSAAPQVIPVNQPINSYHNPFAIPNVGLTHYKYIQNYPLDSVLIRNPHNPYAARPVFNKYPNKIKQPAHNPVLQQLTNVQPIHFGQYPTSKPLDVFGKPVEVYVRPTEVSKKPQSSDTEIYKPEVYKLPDSDTASQSLNQQVKTAQQQTFAATTRIPLNSYQQYAFQDSALPPSIIGTFGSFGVQSVKGRDPGYTPTKTTYAPTQPTKQTIFNSFSYSPNLKITSSQFQSTTPKLQTTANHINIGSTYNDFKNVPTQQTKVSTPLKIDPNVGNKGTFRPSPQDPFIKHYQNLDFSKVTASTYNPAIQTSTLANYYNYNFPSQQNAQIQNYFQQQGVNFNYENKNQKTPDNFASNVNEHPSQQFTIPHNGKLELEGTQNSVPYRATYEVTESYESDYITPQSSPASWTITPESYTYGSQKSTEESVTKQEYFDTTINRPTTTPLPDLPEEYAIVTESEKGYENSLGYDNQLESQSRRPLGDDFEPIGKHKLKDYYYKVSTPSFDDQTYSRRTKKPTEPTRLSTQQDQEVTTHLNLNKINNNNETPADALPTLPPNKHFKRPSTSDLIDKDRIRKRNKLRRRRPPLANINRDREETSTRKIIQSSTEPTYTTETEEIHTIRPRVRPTKSKPQPYLTTPSVTTDLTTSALPTTSPTTPTIVKKKLLHRRPVTTPADKYETTTQAYNDSELNKESPIMKIATRPQFSKITSTPFELRNSDIPDYSHKQDEKDTPTSDVAVNLSDKSRADIVKGFSFHRDVKPVEAKQETVPNSKETTTVIIKDSSEISNEVTTTPYVETTTESTGKIQRPRLKNKYQDKNRPRFSVKDYRNRLSSTTSTTEKVIEKQTPKVRFPQRRYNENKFNSETENVTERKRFTPKDPRHKPVNGTEVNEQTEKDIHTVRQSIRQRLTTDQTSEESTQKISSRIRNGSRRPRPTEAITETSSPVTTIRSKRPLRKKVNDSDIAESVQDVTVTETSVNYGQKDDITSEKSRSESAIMKIADKKHQDHIEHLFEHSKRVSDLTLAASKDYNTPGMFKTVSTNSRRIPNYFTIATDDPILPIEAFFPQLNQKKES